MRDRPDQVPRISLLGLSNGFNLQITDSLRTPVGGMSCFPSHSCLTVPGPGILLPEDKHRVGGREKESFTFISILLFFFLVPVNKITIH